MQKRFLLVRAMLARTLVGLSALLPLALSAATYSNAGTGITLTTSNNNWKSITWPWPGIPALESSAISSGTNVTLPLTVATSGVVRLGPDYLNYKFNTSNRFNQQFYAIRNTQMSSNDLLIANVLNRLAYGPTPDDLDNLRTNGAQAYIDSQLAPHTIPNPPDTYTSIQTNSITPLPNSNWTTVMVTGNVSSVTGPLYLYLRDIGDAYIDDVQLTLLFTNITINCVTNYTTNSMPPFEITGTNIVCTTNFQHYRGVNVLTNGDFENTVLVPGSVPNWTEGTNHLQSAVSQQYACSGTNSLHIICNIQGPPANFGSGNSSVQQNIPAGRLTNNHRCVLSFAYLPGPNTHLFTARLSGTGAVGTGADQPPPPSWVYVTQTGNATSSNLYIYLTGLGGITSDIYIDDIKFVAGTVAEVGQNLLRNGDFESPLNPVDWALGTNMTNTAISDKIAHSGLGSLHVIALTSGSTATNAIVQYNISGVTNNATYTLSYWYTPASTLSGRGGVGLTVRLSGSDATTGINSLPDASAGGLHRRLDAANWGVDLNSMRAWFCNNAVTSPRQLLEILNQFFENHFVTYHSKSVDYLDRFYDDGGLMDRIATDMEYRENSRWRAALLNPNCTFYDLLKIHVESPAEIIYLDTVESRADGTQIANENYSREILELFCNGVDNGYDQYDIVAQSRAWSGWTVDLVDRTQINNPFAPQSRQYGYYPGNGSSGTSNLIGVWSFVFNPATHGTNRAPIFSVWNTNSPNFNAANPQPVPGDTGKRYAARFGAPWANTPYRIVLPQNRATGNTNGLQDGYDVIASLAVNLHTAEYLSVKLCRLFVHDNFPNPTTRTDLPEYNFYDYSSAANMTTNAEARLVHDCMVAWDTPSGDGRKGHIWSVLTTIFNSDLFRSHAGSRQKVKTPLEFVVSAVRSCRSVDSTGATASTDGVFNTPLGRMGQMSLFNRADPDGYPETGFAWISAGTLAERLRFVQSLCSDPGQTGGRPGDAGNSIVDPFLLVQRKLPNARNDAAQVADLFLYYFYFGEGKANLELYRQAAIDFLNDGSTDTGGATTRTFAQLTNFTRNSSYDYRLRGMVAMLLTLQRFEEQ